jgi:hypothetical protein
MPPHHTLRRRPLGDGAQGSGSVRRRGDGRRRRLGQAGGLGSSEPLLDDTGATRAVGRADLYSSRHRGSCTRPSLVATRRRGGRGRGMWSSSRARGMFFVACIRSAYRHRRTWCRGGVCGT